MSYDLLAIKYQEQIFLGPDLTSWAPLNELNVHYVAILKWPNISKYHVLVSGCTSLKNKPWGSYSRFQKMDMTFLSHPSLPNAEQT